MCQHGHGRHHTGLIRDEKAPLRGGFGGGCPLNRTVCLLAGAGMADRALILGATGGIGAALVAECSARGAQVVGLSRRDGLDISSAESVAQAMGALKGPFDRVVVATGVLAPDGGRPEKSLGAITPEAMAHVYAVNTIGPALILANISKLLPKDRRSVVAVLTARVGSIGDNHLGGWHSYRASKAAANQIVRGTAIELKRKFPLSICVALHPGTVQTPFTAGYPAHDKHSPDMAARHLIQVMDGLSPEDTGQFLDWKGEAVPW